MFKLYKRIIHVYQNEGLMSLFKRLFKFLLSAPFEYETFYLQESTPQEEDEADFLPKIANVSFKLIQRGSQLDELLDDGFNLSWLDVVQTKQRLDKGAIVTFLFVGRELAYRGWIAMTQQAKDTFNPYPYKVDFSNNEVCIGDVLVHPKFRRLGLLKYAMYNRSQFFWKSGVKKVRAIIFTHNIPAQKAGAQRRGRLYAKARYIRIFGIRFWKETPIT